MNQLSTASHQTPRFQEKRDAILDSAARLFNQKGVKGGTLADVAKSVGLVTHSVTYYYRKKEDLATACFLRAIEAVDAIVLQVKSAPGAAERIRAFIGAYLEFIAGIALGRHPNIVRFNDVRSLTGPHAETVFAAYTDMFRRLRALLQDEAAAFSRPELNARAHLLLSLATWTRAWVVRYDIGDYGRVAERVSDILLHGIGAPASRWNLRALPIARPPVPNAADEVNAEAFLRAATHLVNEQGYRGASVDKISARLKVTKGSFYHHHDNKDELISACFERTFAVVSRAQELAAAASGTGWLRLCAASSALVGYQLSKDGPLLRVSAWSALPEPVRSEKLLALNRIAERFANLIVEGMIDGSIRVLDQSIAAQLVSGMINAAAEIERWVPGVNEDNAADLYARPLFMGLLSAAD